MKEPKESDLCKQFVREVKRLRHWNQYATEFEIMHVVNENPVTWSKSAAKAQIYINHQYSMGMIPGAPDYLLIFHPGKIAAIEFKRDKSCKLSPKQEEFKLLSAKLEIPYLCTYQVEEALQFVEKLLGKRN